MKLRKPTAITAALLMAVGGVSMAEASAPSIAAAPVTQAVSNKKVKVATYNIQGNVLTNITKKNRSSRLAKLNAIVGHLIDLDADVIMLQESDSGESEGGLNTVEAIRNQLVFLTGQEWYRKYMVKCTEKDEPGVANVQRMVSILSTAPITNTARFHNDGQSGSKWKRGDSHATCPVDQAKTGYPRAMLTAETHGLRVTSVHLAPGSQNGTQRASDIKYMLSQDAVTGKGDFTTARGFVIAGDFNANYSEIQSNLKYRDGSTTKQLTWVSSGKGWTKTKEKGAVRRIDHIFASANLRRTGPVEVVGKKLVYDDSGAGHYPSDHRAVGAAVINR